MTGLLRRVRRAADAAGSRRGRPVLILVRVMDSVEACRAMGVDLEKWCADGLVDIVAGGSEIRLNQPDYLGALARKYPHVKFYMVQTDAQIGGQHPLLTRNRSRLNFRGQAAAAYAGGVHGVYSYNEYTPQAVCASYLRDIGDREKLPGMNKLYYFSQSFLLPDRFGRDWGRFQKMPSLTPAAQLPLFSQSARELELFAGAETPGARFRLLLWVSGIAPDAVQAQFNGVPLGNGRELRGLAVYDVPETAVKPGRNRVTISSRAPSGARQILSGKEILVYQVNQGAWRRLYSAGFVPGKSEEITGGGYLVRDLSDKHFHNLAYPWDAAPSHRIEIDLEAKVLPGSAPDTAMLRLADGVHAEYLQLLPDKIRLKNAGKSFALDTVSEFRRYHVVLEKDHISVAVDGKPALQGKLETPWSADSRLVVDRAAEKCGWLGQNSLVLGSLSPEGTGGGIYRNLALCNRAHSGVLLDGALLAVHSSDDPEVMPYLDIPPLASRIAGEPVWKFRLAADERDKWKASSFNSENLRSDESVIVIDSRRAGPVLSSGLPARQGELVVLDLDIDPLDKECRKSQLQAVVTAPGSDGGGRLWGYRFGFDNVRFLDEAPVPLPRNASGRVSARIVIDPALGLGELYVNGSAKPLLRNPGFGATRRDFSVSVGDGSVAVEGRCGIHEAAVSGYAEK